MRRRPQCGRGAAVCGPAGAPRAAWHFQGGGTWPGGDLLAGEGMQEQAITYFMIVKLHCCVLAWN